MRIAVKICGINDPVALAAAVAGGARYVGFVFYPRSPRAVVPALAAEFARQVPTLVRTVGLFVDADDAFLEHVVSQVPLDLLQLHGNESPARTRDIRSRFDIPVMKAIKIATAADLAIVDPYLSVADRLLFDAKHTAAAALPGGNGVAFDWSILAGRTWTRPWMLSGGLNSDNLAAALAISGATAVDVSSGVEDRPGHKDPERIRRFLAAA
ncbi:MAG: phosphoribosylanthranilate isomerase [Azospirillaceae bacterium]|nr:phosphoribosylanthranilate isomerase [Azospirillaceae bacterium]